MLYRQVDAVAVHDCRIEPLADTSPWANSDKPRPGIEAGLGIPLSLYSLGTLSWLPRLGTGAECGLGDK